MRHMFLLLLLGTWLCGCTISPTPRPCAEIVNRDLRGLLAQRAPNDELQSKIAELYNLPLNKVDASSGGFAWATDGVIRKLITEIPFNPDYPPAAGIEFTNHQPSTQQALDCLGTPDAYGAWYHATPGSAYQPFLFFQMYYVREGIAVSVVQAGERNQPPRLDGTNLITDIYYVAPSSPEKTMEELTWGISAERKAKIKPWPGSWQDIVVAIEPSAR